MARGKAAQHSLPNVRRLTIIAQDPSIQVGGRILTAEVNVPAEELADGPCGYRVKVIDYDASTDTLYKPATYRPPTNGRYSDTYALKGKWTAQYDRMLLNDPRFHAQNVYAIIMRTLARFEFALGRRVPWGSEGHQIHVAPHGFADANAFYSESDRGIFFGYFPGASGQVVHTCLSHDIVVHETTHAILDGLRDRYTEPSSPDQAAFHEGFADVVALLSVFSLEEIVGRLLGNGRGGALIDERLLKRKALQKSILFGLAEQMGSQLSNLREQALRTSVRLEPGKDYTADPEFQEPHRRGELLVAAMMNAFLDIWLNRIARIGRLRGRGKDRSLVVEEGARVADHLLTMAIRAIDYCPPTDINFCDYLAALLTIDAEIVPDDLKYDYRGTLRRNFEAYGIKPPASTNPDGTWKRFDKPLDYGRAHFDSLLRDREEVFRFIWENRKTLGISDDGYVECANVRPCIRVGPDGFVLRETVAEYTQILTLMVGELKQTLNIEPPAGLPPSQRVRVFAGGALVFDEYGRLKYQISNSLHDAKRQSARLSYLSRAGFFDERLGARSHFARMHIARATL